MAPLLLFRPPDSVGSGFSHWVLKAHVNPWGNVPTRDKIHRADRTAIRKAGSTTGFRASFLVLRKVRDEKAAL
jgi:hypothetical protein